MKEMNLSAPSAKSVIYCGAGAFEKFARVAGQKYLVTDDNVYALYKNLIVAHFGAETPKTVLKAGEESKTLDNLYLILTDMLAHGMKRNCTVIAFGGGVIGDIAGLAASLYMRGTYLLQIPTTLLAQVDSSVGGKTAVDLGKVKNAVGSFYQPQEVIVDPIFLRTLPEREIRCGLGEIVKYGALDKGIYAKLLGADLFDYNFPEDIIIDCIAHKIKVVEEDERDEGGVRKTLNLGHTTGHALELFFGGKSHGEFVLAGMYYELYIAEKRGICGGQYAKNLKKLIINAFGGKPCFKGIEEAAKLAAYDKKNTDSAISVIAPATEGRSAEIKLAQDEYINLLRECVGSGW